MPIRLTTHRVESGEQLVCAHSKTFPEVGDNVFQFTNPHGVVLTFRSVRFAEAHLKNNPKDKS